MKHLNRVGVAVLGTLLAGSAFARYNDSYFDYAQVLSVNPIVADATREVTQQECWTEPVEHYHPGITAQRQLPPEVDESTGAVTTRSVSIEKGGYYTRDEREQCRTRTGFSAPSTVAFDVVYSYHNQSYHDRIAHDPGSRVRVHVDNGYVEIAE